MAQSRVLQAVCFVALALSTVSSQQLKAGVLPCVDEKTTNSIGGCHTCKDILCPFGTCKDTPTGPVCKLDPVESCSIILCAEGFKCIKGKCIPVDKTCAAIVCRPPQKCVEGPKGPVCQLPCLDGLTRSPPGDCLSCKNVLCAKGTNCQMTPTGPKCINCNSIPCPKIFAPVCGSDGVTYPNNCKPKCLGIKFTKGPCKKTCKDIACPGGVCVQTPKGPICKIISPGLCKRKCPRGFKCVKGKCVKICKGLNCPIVKGL